LKPTNWLWGQCWRSKFNNWNQNRWQC
jgi:hypothetical protein